MTRDSIDIEVSGPEGPLHNVLSPFTASNPAQLLIELIKGRDNIENLVAIARDRNGRLYVTWTDQDLADLTEALKTLDITVGLALFQTHCKSDPEEDKHPGLDLSRVENEHLSENEDG